MLTVIYDPLDGECVPDSGLNALVQNIANVNWSRTTAQWSYANESVFNEIRAWIAEGKLDYQQVQFEFKGNLYSIAQDGILNNWPGEFLQINLHQCQRILRAGINQRRAEKGLEPFA